MFLQTKKQMNMKPLKDSCNFVDCNKKTGDTITNLILQTLKKCNIPISECYVQGYDNGSEWSIQGLQTQILEINPLAIFSPCACHSLNLCGVHAAEYCHEHGAVSIMKELKASGMANTDSTNELLTELCEHFLCVCNPLYWQDINSNVSEIHLTEKKETTRKLKRRTYSILLKFSHYGHASQYSSFPEGFSEVHMILAIIYNMRLERKYDDANNLETFLNKLKTGTNQYTEDIQQCLKFLIHLSGSGEIEKPLLGQLKPLPKLFLEKGECCVLPLGPRIYGDTSVVENSDFFVYYPREIFEQINPITTPPFASQQNALFEMCPGYDLNGNELFSVTNYPVTKEDKDESQSLLGALFHKPRIRGRSLLGVKLEIPELSTSTTLRPIDFKISSISSSGTSSTRKTMTETLSEDEGFIESDSPLSNKYLSVAGEDIWETALKTEPKTWFTWETIGCYAVEKEKPYLTEAGPEVMNMLYQTHQHELLLMDPSYQSTASITISRDALMRDVVNLLIGIPSETFLFIKKKQIFKLRPGIHINGLTPDSTGKLLADFIETGTLYHKLERFSLDSVPGSRCTGGLVLQAFKGGVCQYLQCYRVSVLSIVQHCKCFTVLGLDNTFRSLRKQIRFMAGLCKCKLYDDSSTSVKKLPVGVELLTYLYETALEHWDQENYLVLVFLLKSATAPYLRFLHEWLFEGECNDHYNEFHVQQNLAYVNAKDESYWIKCFIQTSQDLKCVPQFLSHIASDIFVCGKSIHLLKLCCQKVLDMEAKKTSWQVVYMDDLSQILPPNKLDYKLSVVMLRRMAGLQFVVVDSLINIALGWSLKTVNTFSEVFSVKHYLCSSKSNPPPLILSFSEKNVSCIEKESKNYVKSMLTIAQEEHRTAEQQREKEEKEKRATLLQIQLKRSENLAKLQRRQDDAKKSMEEKKQKQFLELKAQIEENMASRQQEKNKVHEEDEKLKTLIKQEEKMKLKLRKDIEAEYQKQAEQFENRKMKAEWVTRKIQLNWENISFREQHIAVHSPNMATENGNITISEEKSKCFNSFQMGNNNTIQADVIENQKITEPIEETSAVDNMLEEAYSDKVAAAFLSSEDLSSWAVPKDNEPVSQKSNTSNKNLIEPYSEDLNQLLQSPIDLPGWAAKEFQNSPEKSLSQMEFIYSGKKYSESKTPKLKCVSTVSSKRRKSWYGDDDKEDVCIDDIHISPLGILFCSKSNTLIQSRGCNIHGHASDSTVQELLYNKNVNFSCATKDVKSRLDSPDFNILTGLKKLETTSADVGRNELVKGNVKEINVKCSAYKELDEKLVDKKTDVIWDDNFKNESIVLETKGSFTESENIFEPNPVLPLPKMNSNNKSLDSTLIGQGLYTDDKLSICDWGKRNECKETWKDELRDNVSNTVLKYRGRNIHGHASDSTIQKLLYGKIKGKELRSGQEEEHTEKLEEVIQHDIALLSAAYTSSYRKDYSVLDDSPLPDLLTHIPCNSQGAYCKEGEDISCCHYVPLPALLNRALLPVIQAQIKLVNKSIIDYFLVDIRINDHFTALHNFFFFHDGEFGHSLSQLFFDKVSKCHLPSDLLNPFTLSSILLQALSSSLNGDSSHADCLTFAIKSVPVAFPSNAPNILSCIDLRYKVEWPCNIIITEKSLDYYNKVLELLLQVKRSLWCLTDIWFHLKRTARYHKLDYSPQYRQLQLYRHEMQHFARVMQSYIASQVLQVTWQEFQTTLLHVVHSLDDLRDAHASYLKKACYRCLLCKKSAPVMKIIQDIFAIILKFWSQLLHSHWQENRNTGHLEHPAFHALVASYKIFKEYSSFLYKVLKKLVVKGYQPHLQDFLVMLDFNYYHQQATGKWNDNAETSKS